MGNLVVHRLLYCNDYVCVTDDPKMTSFAKAARKSQTSNAFIPHPYQIDAIHWSLENPDTGLFLPPGLGKTAIVLQAFLHMREYGGIDKMFIIAPIRPMYLVWPDEIKKWAQFNGLTIAILHGPKKNHSTRVDADIYIINPEGIKWFNNIAKDFFDGNNWLFVVDESSNFKNARSQRFKMVRKWLTWFDRSMILTATPAPNGLINLWSQIYILDSGKRLGKFVTAF